MSQSPHLEITAITVAYNSSATIRDTLQSVLDHGPGDYEYIVVDGGSIDGTIEIVRSFEEAFAQLGVKYRWISEPDKGIYDAMNKGVAMASGRFVNFINSDDWYAKNSIHKVCSFLEKNGGEVDVLFGNISMVKPSGEELLKKPKPPTSLRKGQSIYFPAVFIRRAHLKKPDAFDTDYRLASDYKFLLESYFQGRRFKYFDANLAYYRLGGSTSQNIRKSWKEVKKIAVEQGIDKFEAQFYFYEKLVKRYILQLLKKV